VLLLVVYDGPLTLGHENCQIAGAGLA